MTERSEGIIWQSPTESPWGPVQPAMEAATARVPTTIAGVVEQLDEVQRALERLPELYGENPVADFNNLYATITRRILQRYEAGSFHDSDFLTLLDVEFAKRYLHALRLWGLGDPATPAAWSVLFRRYNDADLRSLPCAVAGVNAHINYDLAFALVATWEQLGYALDGSPQHKDYLLVNDVFAHEIPGLRRRFLSAWQRCIDRVNGDFDDWYQNLLVEFSRNRAWDGAQRLWAMRDRGDAYERERAALDREAARIGGFLLSPFCKLLQ
jgi:hypothetical protein